MLMDMFYICNLLCNNYFLAGWQSGYAADCNSVNIGSIPFSASIPIEGLNQESLEYDQRQLQSPHLSTHSTIL